MTKQNLDYGYDVQKVYLEIMLTDAATFVRCQSVFDPKSFDRRLQPVAEFISKYVNEHNILPTFEMVNSYTKADLKNPGTLREEHYDWLLGEFETFARHKALEAAILKSADLLEKGEYGPVEDLVKRAVQIGLQKDLGTDYFANPRARLEAIKDQNGQVSTGWAELDRKLFGGFSRGELNIFAGGSGAGKSLFLANLGVNWALIGMNVMYLTFELSENLVSMRIDSMITGTPSRDVFKSIDDVEMRVKMIGKKAGAFQVKYMPSGKNANDIRSYLKEYEIKTGRKIDVLLIDYLDLMMPVGVKVSPSDLFVKDKYVSEELRNLAMELNTVFVTASQLNRCLTLDTQVEVKGKGKIQIKDVEEGDLILSDTGYNTVINVFPVTKQKVYQIKTKSGKTIRCSAEHIFPTGNREKKISTGLSVGDILYRKRMCKIFNNIEIEEDEIVEIIEIGYEDTIDIETDGNHLFFANDLLTHNSAVEEIEFDHSHISGGLSKIQTADNVIGIFTSRAMRERGRYQIQLMKTRSSSGVGTKIDLEFDIETLRIKDCEQSDENDSPTTQNISNIIKRSSQMQQSENQQPQASSSTRLRKLLDDLEEE